MTMNHNAHVITQEQKECLVEFLEDHEFLVNSQKKTKAHVEQSKRAWNELMILLNSKPGPKKTVPQWKEALKEMKAKVTNRARAIEMQSKDRYLKQTEKDLTPLEHKLLLISSDRYYQSVT